MGFIKNALKISKVNSTACAPNKNKTFHRQAFCTTNWLSKCPFISPILVTLWKFEAATLKKNWLRVSEKNLQFPVSAYQSRQNVTSWFGVKRHASHCVQSRKYTLLFVLPYFRALTVPKIAVHTVRSYRLPYPYKNRPSYRYEGRYDWYN